MDHTTPHIFWSWSSLRNQVQCEVLESPLVLLQSEVNLGKNELKIWERLNERGERMSKESPYEGIIKRTRV